MLSSLVPDDDDGLAPSEWEAAWAAEIDRRVREIRDGRVQLVEGDEAMTELREIARRP